MTDASDGGPDNQGPTKRLGSASHLATGRAVAIIVVGIIVGVLLIDVAARPPAPVPIATATTTTVPGSTVPTTLPTATTTTIAPSASVKVLVENGTTVGGAAAKYADFLTSLGWGTITPLDSTQPATATTVYYVPGYKTDAKAVAAEIGEAKPAVTPLSTTAPVQGTAGANVIVLLGADLASATPAVPTGMTTTTAAAG